MFSLSPTPTTSAGSPQVLSQLLRQRTFSSRRMRREPCLAGVIARRLLPAMSLGETDSAARSAEGYLRDGKFIRYLDYLQYWKEPQYTK